jgi:hypothetical protein
MGSENGYKGLYRGLSLAIFRNLIFFVLFPIQAARKAMANAQ